MRKRIFTLMLAVISVISCFGVVKAETEYMSAEDARYFLAFAYNADADHVTQAALEDDIFYKMLTGAYSNNSTYELAAKAAFLSHLDARIIYTLEKANIAAKTSREYLIDYFSKNLDEDSTGLVTDIYKENVAGSILELCGGEMVLPLLETVTDVVEDPDKYLDDVKAIASAFTYAYGQNVASLYTYFDVAVSNVYLKSTPGAYETAMAYTVLALKESNFMSFAAQLIPGIPSWEDWISKMDYWAEFVYNMKGQVSAGNSSDFQLVVYHPNCDDLEIKVLWYTGGQLYAPKMERERYVLQGWYLDEKCTIGPIKNEYVPNDDVVYLYAKWEPRYFNICFDSNCDDVEDYTYELDRLNVNWYEPVMKRAGYIFTGWYWDSACKKPVEGEFEVSGNMTFYAGWISQFGYTVSGGKATISNISITEKDENGNPVYDLVIPEKIGGYPVVDVDLRYDKNAITGITFPNSMTNIRKSSFTWAKKLEKVVFKDGTAVIEEGAFARCAKLSSVTFGRGLKTIGYEAFTDCPQITSLDFPEGLVTIDRYAFSSCGISELKIPDSVTTIGENAFSYCENLKTVTLGKGISSISGNVFEGCSSIENITVSPDNPYYTSVDGVLYNKDKTVLCKYPAAKPDKTFELPDTVTEIGEFAFYGCTALENIDISKVKKIGERAFMYCENLVFADLSAADDIGIYGFRGCKNLKNVNMPEKIKELKDGTFEECVVLEEISLPEGLESIGWTCFYGCETLEEVIIPESVTFMDSSVFSGCKKLKKVNLPQTLTEIPSSLFYGCESLEEIEIPETVTWIWYSAFANCKKLKNIDIPKAVTYICAGAFSNCKALEKIIIPDGITYFEESIFYGCDSLKKIIIPETVTYVDSDNFPNTSVNTEVYFLGTKEQWDEVSISEWGNEYLTATKVICNSKVIGEFANLKREGTKISGEVSYDRIAESTDVLVALTEGGKLIEVKILKADVGSTKTDFDFECEKDKKYEIKAFFWDCSDFTPEGKEQYTEI